MVKSARPDPKRAKRAKEKALPLCTALLICEQAILGKDDVFSAIRIVDVLNLGAGDIPPIGQYVEISALKLLIMLKQGDARGHFTFQLSSTDPSDVKSPIGTASCELKGEPDGGTNIVSPLRFKWGGEGLYWIDISSGGRKIAKTSLRLKPAVKPTSDKTTKE